MVPDTGGEHRSLVALVEQQANRYVQRSSELGRVKGTHQRIGEPFAGLCGQQVRAARVPVLNTGSSARQGERLVAETTDPVLRLKRAPALDAYASTNGVVNGMAKRVRAVTWSSADGLVGFPE